ncbi:MAG: ABC transporter permease, partial [Candidatus Methanomethylophilaceae archaeon]|nr:ABC transporter permease [Candidatus Methanomethylophilaceae archaeon]
AVWGAIPAVFKAKWNTNETLFTLMMNYIAMQLVTFTIAKWVPTGSGTLNILNADTRCGWLPAVNIAGTDQKYFINVLVVFILTILMYVYLKFTKQGYEIAVVGESVNTANYVGINVKKVIIRTVLISGAICGITGFLLVAGDGHTVSTGIASGNGFTAILVSWLSKFNPLIMILSSFLIVFMQRGASGIASTFNMDNSIADIITAIILFFIIGVEFFINYQIVWTSRTGKEAEG